MIKYATCLFFIICAMVMSGCNDNSAVTQEQLNDSLIIRSTDSTEQSNFSESMRQAMDDYSSALSQNDSIKQAESLNKLEKLLLNRDFTMNQLQLKFDEVVISLNNLIEEHGLEEELNDPNHEVAKLKRKITLTLQRNKLTEQEQKEVLTQIAALKSLVQKQEQAINNPK